MMSKLKFYEVFNKKSNFNWKHLNEAHFKRAIHKKATWILIQEGLFIKIQCDLYHPNALTKLPQNELCLGHDFSDMKIKLTISSSFKYDNFFIFKYIIFLLEHGENENQIAENNFAKLK